MKRLIHLLVLITFMLLISGCNRKPAIEPSGKKIKIGIIAAFSGADLVKGKEGVKGVKIGMQLQPYLDNGDGIELVLGDDKDDSTLTVKLLKKLAEVDKVSAIVTFSSSGQVLAMADVADTVIFTGLWIFHQVHIIGATGFSDKTDLLAVKRLADHPIGAGCHLVLDHIDVVVTMGIMAVPAELAAFPDNIINIISVT